MVVCLPRRLFLVLAFGRLFLVLEVKMAAYISVCHGDRRLFLVLEVEMVVYLSVWCGDGRLFQM